MIVSFIEENKETWEDRRSKQESEKADQELRWEEMSREEKREQFEEDELIRITENAEKTEKTDPETARNNRLKNIKVMKENWRKWREQESTETEEGEWAELETCQEERDKDTEKLEEHRNREEEDIELARLLEETEKENKMRELLETELCLICVHAPCLCMWTKLEMRIELLRETKGKSITKEINTQYTAEHNCYSCAPHSVLAGEQNCSPCASKSEKILTKNREGPSQINIEQKCSKIV